MTKRIIELERVVVKTTRYFADGVEVSHDEFWRIWNSAARLDSMITETRRDMTIYYTSAHMDEA